MLIENKWVVYDSNDDTYFTGLRDLTDPEGNPIRDLESGGVAQAPVMEALNSRVRTYKNERGAKQAIRQIIDVSPADHTVLCELKAVYIEKQDVPDVPGDVKDNPSDKPGQTSVAIPNEPPVIKNDGKWTIVDSFGRIKYMKKTTTSKPVFGVLDENSELRGFGFDELAAWKWYSDRRRDIGIKIITEREVNGK